MLKGVLNRAERAQKGAFEGHSFGEGGAMPCRGLLLNQLIDMLQYYILTDANSLYMYVL